MPYTLPVGFSFVGAGSPATAGPTNQYGFAAGSLNFQPASDFATVKPAAPTVTPTTTAVAPVAPASVATPAPAPTVMAAPTPVATPMSMPTPAPTVMAAPAPTTTAAPTFNLPAGFSLKTPTAPVAPTPAPAPIADRTMPIAQAPTPAPAPTQPPSRQTQAQLRTNWTDIVPKTLSTGETVYYSPSAYGGSGGTVSFDAAGNPQVRGFTGDPTRIAAPAPAPVVAPTPSMAAPAPIVTPAPTPAPAPAPKPVAGPVAPAAPKPVAAAAPAPKPVPVEPRTAALLNSGYTQAQIDAAGGPGALLAKVNTQTSVPGQSIKNATAAVNYTFNDLKSAVTALQRANPKMNISGIPVSKWSDVGVAGMAKTDPAIFKALQPYLPKY